MKKLFYINFLVGLFLISPFISKAEFGFFGSAVYIEKNGSSAFYNCFGSNIGSQPFSGSLGTFAQNSGLLKLQGAEIKTWKDAGSNVCTPIFKYRIYISGSPSGSFTSENLPWFCNCTGFSFSSCGGGACTENNQKWQKPGNTGSGLNVDLTTYAPGTYTIEVYYQVPGSVNSTSGCTDSKSDSNGGSNYTASFTITSPLPVTLSSFQGKSVKEGVQLWWEAQSESNFKQYEIEKSKNNQDWKTIGNALPNASGKYSFLDQSPYYGDNYYRLKQVDHDGSSFYSTIVTVAQKANTVLVYPNPTANDILIEGIEELGVATIVIEDIHGKEVLNQVAQKNVNLSQLPSGLYVMKFINQNNDVISTQKLQKL